MRCQSSSVVSASGAESPAPALRHEHLDRPPLVARRAAKAASTAAGSVTSAGTTSDVARQPGRDRLERRRVPAEQRDPVSVRGQRSGHRRADTPAGPGDQADA